MTPKMLLENELNASEALEQPNLLETLHLLMTGIRSDSQREPEKYLAETEVPHGGE